MKLPWIFFAALLAMCLILTLILAGETHYGRGDEHPEYPTMQRSGMLAQSYPSSLWLAWLLGSVEILLFMLCLGLASSRGDKLGRMRLPLLLVGLLYLTIFGLLMFLSMTGTRGASALLLSFPVGSVVMMLGLWLLIPICLSLLYFLNFDSWILTPDDRRRFEQLQGVQSALPEDDS